MSKYKEECKKFLDDLPKMDKEFQERTLRRYEGNTRIFLLQYGNNIEEYMENRRKDHIYIDYYDVCKVLGIEPEDIRKKDTLLERINKRMSEKYKDIKG